MSAADRAPSLAASEDSARAETLLPLPFAEVAAAFDDLEAAFRLNPHLEVREWMRLADGFYLGAVNELGARELSSEAKVTRTGAASALRLRIDWTHGLKQATEVEIVAEPGGTRLTVLDFYPQIQDHADPRLVDVDRTLVPWVAAIRRHLLARRRWRWVPGWHWWNERLLPGMAPRARRIVRLLVWISLIEFLVFVVAVLVLRAAS